MSDGVELLLRAAGGLVALGGLVVLYLLAVDRTTERVLAAFGATSERHATLRQLALSGIALVAFAAGLSLAALHRSAPVLMLVAAAVQALWRMGVKRWLPEEDAAAVAGREAARVALMLHLVVTAGVLIIDWRAPDIWRDGGTVWLAAAVAAVALAVAFNRFFGSHRDGT